MGFFFDSLVHLLATEQATKRAALARLLGRALKAEPVDLQEAGGDPGIWHFPKVVGRPWAVSVTIGLASTGQRELVALTLADAVGDRAVQVSALLRAVVETPRGDLVALPEGTLGRSSHTWAVIGDLHGTLREHAEYERILGARLDLVIPVTEREATWIRAHGLARYQEAMRSEGVAPWADRVPGGTTLPA